MLSWSKVSGAVKYEVQVDNDCGFRSPAFTSTTTNNRAVPTSLLATGEQNFRVRAINSSGTGSLGAGGLHHLGVRPPHPGLAGRRPGPGPA